MIGEIKLHREELQALCRRFHVRRLDLFGSAARGDFDPKRSDVDFLVEFDRSAPLHPFDSYLGLKEALEELFGRPIDLVEARCAIRISKRASRPRASRSLRRERMLAKRSPSKW
jgi:predicted nucleotidyltransferase